MPEGRLRPRLQRGVPAVGGDQPRSDAAPDPDDYRWLTDVYESVRPSDITGRLVWHALGAKTLDLINEHVEVEIPQTTGDDRSRRPGHRRPHERQAARTTPEEIEKQITARIARHLNNPVFVELGNRLNELTRKVRRHPAVQPRLPPRTTPAGPGHRRGGEAGWRESHARNRARPPSPSCSKSLQGDGTPIIVENIVNRIDEVVRARPFRRVAEHLTAATRRSARRSARPSTSSSRSATTTSSRRLSATSGNTTEARC